MVVCGPLGGRWMYSCEQYLGTPKKFVRSKEHPEASMANGYVVEDTLGLCMEYLNVQANMKRHVWETEEEQGLKATVVEGRGRVHNMPRLELCRAHKYVILHHAITLDMRR